MKYNDNGTIKEIKVKSFDTLPVGAEVDYDGSTVPDGWTEVEDKGEIYSTDEVRIGTWIDGKPLYRKVLTYTIPSGTTSSGVSVGVSNLATILRADVRYNNVSGDDYVYNSYYSSSTDFMRFFIRNNSLQVRLGANTHGFNIVAILEYTKTTD